jgi:adenine phosphoribosyltransferase
MELKQYIREVPDFPKPGISFKDITPLLKNPIAFRHVIKRFAEFGSDREVDLIAGIDARGFLFAAPLAIQLGLPFIPVRKEGKLPYQTTSMGYSLEYGDSSMEIHTDAIIKGQRVLIIDDLLATGGTMDASARLIQRCGGEVVGHAVVIELVDLGGRDRLKGNSVVSLIQY